MTKKLLISALALLVAAPMAMAAVDNACAGGAAAQVIAVGSSAQFNATAYAAKQIITDAGGSYNLFSVKGKDSAGSGTANIIDHRIAGDPADSATLWVIWDGATSPCHFWAYYSTDSTVGVKDFLAYGKNGTKSVAFAYGSHSGLMDGHLGHTWCTGSSSCSQGKVFGLADTTLYDGFDELPVSIINALNSHPDGTGSAPSYCASGVYCFFNAGATDIRPEDALYATTRALSNYDSKSLKGLGYNSAQCGGDGLSSGSKIGCPIYSAMGTGAKFYVSAFKLTGSDPIASGAVPASQTLSVGASPQLVIVNDEDSTGFGRKSGGNYVFTNINREILSEVFQGNLIRTDDLLSTSATANTKVGQPIQVIYREPLSGTYNTFEFTGVRTLYGSGRTIAAFKSGAAGNIQSNAWSGQEIGVNPAGDGVTFFNYCTTGSCTHGDATACPSGATFPTGLKQCVDPMWLTSPFDSNAKRIRAIGTGEEVPAIVDQQTGQVGSASQAPNGIGYTFWSFGNVKPASGHGHYLTVDGIDPLFNSPTDGTNLAGNYKIPTCPTQPCAQVIPFTHVQDGTYPLWSLLRMVTFKTAPVAVTALVNEEISLSNTDTLDEYLPLKDVSGNLQLFVFRSHFKQTNNAVNGYALAACTTFNPVPAGCLVDAGGDVGGAVVTVQADINFFKDTGMELVGVSQ